MPHQEHNDWPSFETVLRDVAPDSPAARSLASADRRAKYAESASAIRASRATVVGTETSPPPATQERDSSSFSVVRQTSSNLSSTTDFPAPLEPLEIDTSSIRALIEPQGGPSPALDDPALDALAPLPALEVELYEELEPDLLDTVIDQDSALDLFEDREPAVFTEDATFDSVEPQETFEAIQVEGANDVEPEETAHEYVQDELAYDEPVGAIADNEPVAAHVEVRSDQIEFTEASTFDTDFSFDADADASVVEFETLTFDEPFDSPAPSFDTAVEAVENTEDDPGTSAIDPDTPAFDPVADGIEFGSSTPWATEADFGDDDSLVFELDDSTITEVDAAFAAGSQASELADPFFDAGGEPDAAADDLVFSTTDVPKLPEPNLLDDPFGGVSTDLSPDPIVPGPAFVTNEPAEDANGSLWGLDLGDEPSVVDVDELAVDDLETIEIPDVTTISYGGSESDIELPDTSYAAESFDDLAPMADEQLDLSNLGETDEVDDRRVLDPDEIDQRKADLFDFSGADTIELPGDATEFDSVATAEEIENHLDSLLNYEEQASADLDNVIPLRRDVDLQADFHNELAKTTAEGNGSSDLFGNDAFADNTLEDNTLQDNTLQDNVEQFNIELAADNSDAPDNTSVAPSHGGWVSLPPEVKTKSPDPWAHMRPTEEPKKKGFWANRPKFFGGEERRRARAQRTPDAESALDDNVVGISYDKACPNCSTECQVDLDDPIGRRVHVSCPSCQHMWHTPYILEDSQAG